DAQVARGAVVRVPAVQDGRDRDGGDEGAAGSSGARRDPSVSADADRSGGGGFGEAGVVDLAVVHARSGGERAGRGRRPDQRIDRARADRGGGEPDFVQRGGDERVGYPYQS